MFLRIIITSSIPRCIIHQIERSPTTILVCLYACFLPSHHSVLVQVWALQSFKSAPKRCASLKRQHTLLREFGFTGTMSCTLDAATPPQRGLSPSIVTRTSAVRLLNSVHAYVPSPRRRQSPSRMQCSLLFSNIEGMSRGNASPTCSHI